MRSLRLNIFHCRSNSHGDIGDLGDNGDALEQPIKQSNNQTIKQFSTPHNCSKRILDENQKLAVIEVPRRREPDKKTDWQATAALKKQAEVAAFFPELSKLSELSKPPEPPKPVYYCPPKIASLPRKRDLAKTIYLRKRGNS